MVVKDTQKRRSSVSDLTSAAIAEAAAMMRLRKDYEDRLYDMPLWHAMNAMFDRDDSSMWKGLRSALSDLVGDPSANKHFHRWHDVHDQLASQPVGCEDNSWRWPVRVAHAILLREMKEALHRLNGGRLLSMLPFESVSDLDLLWEVKGTSAGAIAPGKSKEQAQEEALLIAKRIKVEVESGLDPKIPFLAFQRSQVSNLGNIEEGYSFEPKQKTRPVQCQDAATNIIDSSVFVPFYDMIKREWWEYSGGDDPSSALTKMTRYLGYYKYVSIDYSKFDQTVPDWLIHLAFNGVRAVFKKEDRVYIDWLERSYIDRDIITPFDKLHLHGGLASGVKGTQPIGSMMNFIMQVAYAAHCSCDGTERFDQMCRKTWNNICDGYHTRCQVLGDDSVNWFELGDTVDLGEYVTRTFGVVVKPEKSHIGRDRSDPAIYLKRTWTRKGCWRDPFELFATLLLEEYYRDYDGRWHKDSSGAPVTFSPWHILLGAYITFPLSFPSWVSLRYFRERLKDRGGVMALRNVDYRNLPGFWRGMGPEYSEGILRLISKMR